jgi:hypothetical protein
MHIIVAVGRMLLSVLYAIFKSGMAYESNWRENGHMARARD